MLGVRVQVSGDAEAVEPAVGTALYLIAAEAVTNATRHACGATGSHRRRHRIPRPGAPAGAR
ncbi:hypothetical protein V2I01_31685 [Micromonospora sp. BRA006-A]|nr:hypothetical protein [Micromonospora sp. BRA006-A]